MKKKILLLLIMVCTILFSLSMVNASAETVHNGTCGENLTWELDDNGTLTISGNGEMSGFYPYSPWYSLKDKIVSVVIENGATSISKLAFYYCTRLESVIIPSTVTTIGQDAFYWCDRLKRVDISDIDAWCKIEFVSSSSNPLIKAGNLYLNGSLVTNLTISESITSINNYVFANCNSITSITIPDSVTNIGVSAFSGCVSLTSAIIGDGVTSIGDYAFSNCSNLKNITMSNSIRKIGTCAFENCSKLANVYYDGYKGQWESTSINAFNAPLKSATIHFVKKTKTMLSNNGKSFTITPINIENGKTVILALYNDEQFVEMQSAVYTGAAVPFTTTKTYTKAKVMVWDDLTNLKPVCEVENVQ